MGIKLDMAGNTYGTSTIPDLFGDCLQLQQIPPNHFPGRSMAQTMQKRRVSFFSDGVLGTYGVKQPQAAAQ